MSQIPESCRLALAGHLQRWVDANCGGSQSEAGRRLGISQAHVSSLLNPHRGRFVGTETLLTLRSKLSLSIDDLLGLPPLSAPVPPQRLDSDAARRVLEFLTSDAMRALMEAADGATPLQRDEEGETGRVARKGPGRS